MCVCVCVCVCVCGREDIVSGWEELSVSQCTSGVVHVVCVRKVWAHRPTLKERTGELMHLK